MLSQYKNIDKILNATTALSGQRFLNKEIDLFSSPALKYAWKNNILNSNPDVNGIEFHVYSGDTWITGNHRIDLQPKNQVTFTDPQSLTNYQLPATPWQVNLFNEFNKLNIQKGQYRIAINFFTNLIGSYESQKLKIDEISPDRTELRLRAINQDDPEFLQQITSYIQNVGNAITSLTDSESYRTLLVNFSRNQTALFTNSVVIGEYVYVKLYEPLPDNIEQGFKCWIVEEQRPTYIDRVILETFGLGITVSTRKLSGPNWDASDRASTSTDTGLKNWNDLLGSSISTSQQLIDSIFSGSLSGINLNIDYSDFNNFIFYSSATERVKNFKYKIELIEYYNSQLNTLGYISGSTAITNIEEFTNLKNTLISGFDEFEKYLYYESSSTPFTYNLPLANPNVSYITGSYINPWPKITTTRPHTLYNSTSSIVQTWYSLLLDTADLYDRANYNSLINGIPLYLRTNPDNEGLETFIHMLGQHYDIIYTYIRNVSKIYSRDEHPKYGIPNELLYSVAKQFGWSLTDGNQYKDLWEYVLGTSESGIPLTGSNSVGEPSLPGKDMTYHVWRRIVNNLPGLLKSKGTKRSIKALLSCYGIPQSIISINEYGGPRLERPPVYEKLNFDYALDLIRNTSGTVTVDYDQPINSIELRFRTDNVLETPTMPSTMNLLSVDSNNVTLDFTRGTLGTIQINGTSSADIEMFDGGWLNVLLRSSSNGSLEVVAKKSKYGKIVAAVSASSTSSFGPQGTIILGGTNGGNRLQGQLQELRLWSSSLQDLPFSNHTKAPGAYNGNIDAYDELLFRLPLTQKINHNTTSSLFGVEPNPSGISASFASWTNAEPYDSIEEIYYYDAISLAAGTFDDNKIRLEDNELVGTLDVKSRAERSQFDKAPLDSNRLGVYFSPQTMINEDIIAQLGFTELDSYIGDPSQIYERSYPDLINAAQSYWKKYETKNDLNAYIKIFTLFDLSFFKQLDQLLPARADKITGLLIQPNILERNKDSFLPRVNKQNLSYDTDIDVQTTTIVSGSYMVYQGGIEGAIATITAQDDDQWQAYLTKSADERYGGTTYVYDYLIWNGTEYITGSTPSWISQPVFLPITGATLSTFRESTIYTEYRKLTYPIIIDIISSSISSSVQNNELLFNLRPQFGDNSFIYETGSTIYATESLFYFEGNDSSSFSINNDNSVIQFLSIQTSSVDIILSSASYLREIEWAEPTSDLEALIEYYELIKNNRTGNGEVNFWETISSSIAQLASYTNADTVTQFNINFPFYIQYNAQDFNNNLNNIQTKLLLGTASASDVTGSFIPYFTSSWQSHIITGSGTGTFNNVYDINATIGDLSTFLNQGIGTTQCVALIQVSASANNNFAGSGGDYIHWQQLNSPTPDSWLSASILYNIESQVTASAIVSSSSPHSESLWVSSGTYSTILTGSYEFIPSGSAVGIIISSSVSASLSASHGDNFNEFTGIEFYITKWGNTGSISTYTIGEDTSNSEIVDQLITVNDLTLSRTGSDTWLTNVQYPTGSPVIYGSSGNTFGLDLNNIVFQSNQTTLKVQPKIQTSVNTNGVELARYRLDKIVLYYNFSGSFITGSISDGFIVVSGSDIESADFGVDINGPAAVQDFIGTGLENSKYNGSKMTSRGFNISSLDTIDGGPVVETRNTNPNQLIYQSPSENGSFTISG